MRTPAVVAAAAALLSMALPSPAVAATPAPSVVSAKATRITDIDGDGRPDVVFAGWDAAGTSSVGVRLATGQVQTVTAAQMAVPLDDEMFAASVAVGDVNADGYADILVDGHTPGADTTAVWVLWGGPDGISGARSKLIVDGIENDGCTLAFVPLPEPVLVVGDPVADNRPGELDLYRLTTDGAVAQQRRLVPGSGGVPGRASGAVDFGISLAASGNLLAAGDPRYAHGSTLGVGSIWLFRLRSGLDFDVLRVDEDTPGIPGRSEDSDAFGTSISLLGDRVVVGAPGESVGRVELAGAVTTFRLVRRNGALAVTGGRQVTQAWPGIPGTVGHFHSFGQEVQATRLCGGVPGALVFAASENGAWHDGDDDGDETIGWVVTAPLIGGRTCSGTMLATHVRSSRQPLSVERTDPRGSGDVPVTLTRNLHIVRLGTSAGVFRVPKVEILLVAPPAA